MDEKEKSIDDSWKESVAKDASDASEPTNADAQGDQQIPEINFLNYVTSLTYQAVIFLGDAPSPITNQIEKNVNQAKFIIDTLAMLKEKTAGNLTKQEDDFLTATVYELQMKYVETVQKDKEGQKEE